MNSIRVHGAIVPIYILGISVPIVIMFPASNASNITTVFFLGTLGRTTSTIK
jgi:hypothetical protein